MSDKEIKQEEVFREVSLVLDEESGTFVQLHRNRYPQKDIPTDEQPQFKKPKS